MAATQDLQKGRLGHNHDGGCDFPYNIITMIIIIIT